ncbi:hypothetical protein PAMP_019289 [Pampus punctatissimus]
MTRAPPVVVVVVVHGAERSSSGSVSSLPQHPAASLPLCVTSAALYPSRSELHLHRLCCF